MNEQEFLDHVRQPFVWPGGYTKHFALQDGGVLCHQCASQEQGLILENISHLRDPQWTPIGVDINWEWELTCDHCGAQIPAEYT